jgi:hypothetical protein
MKFGSEPGLSRLRMPSDWWITKFCPLVWLKFSAVMQGNGLPVERQSSNRWQPMVLE